jgi:hypothetical protein
MKKSKFLNTIIFICLVVVIILISNFFNSQPPKVNLVGKQIEIDCIFGCNLNYTDIAFIDTISQMPKIEIRTNGFSYNKVCKGNFKLSGADNARLYIDFRVSPFIYIKLKNNEEIYLNLKDHQSTIEMFEKIKSKTK